MDGVLVDKTPENGVQDDWHWVRVGAVSLAAGEHTVQLRVREGGIALDAMVLTQNTNPPGA